MSPTFPRPSPSTRSTEPQQLIESEHISSARHTRLENEFWGIPSSAFSPPPRLRWLMAYLNTLEHFGKVPLGEKPWPRLGRPPKFTPVLVHPSEHGGREVWAVESYGVVIKRDPYLGENKEEYRRATQLRHQVQPDEPFQFFPVWGITRGSRLLVMSLAHGIGGGSVRDELMSAVVRAAEHDFQSLDPCAQNFGFVMVGPARHWALLDLG